MRLQALTQLFIIYVETDKRSLLDGSLLIVVKEMKKTVKAATNNNALAERVPRAFNTVMQMVTLATGNSSERELWARMITALGPEPDTFFLGACAMEAEKRGIIDDYESWLFDWYVEGRIPKESDPNDAFPLLSRKRKETGA